MKKKKRIKIWIFLIILLVGISTHHWLSMTNNITKNYGISFGIDGWYFVLLSFIFVISLTIIWWRNNYWGINFVVIGGWINMIDRIVFGYVRDYWNLGWIYNNLADWIIQVGVIIFLTELWMKKLK